MAPPGLMTTDATVPPEPGFIIRGKVVRPDGTPYNGEMVEPLENAGRWPEAVCVQVTGPDCDRSCQINEEGRFECAGLDAAGYVVCVADTLGSHRLFCHGAQVEVGPAAPSADAVLVVGREVSVTVSVLSRESLEPLPDCAVAAEPISGQTPARGITDELGLAELSLIAGQYRIYVPRWEDDRSTGVSPELLTVRTMSGPIVMELRVSVAPPTEDAVTGVLVDSAGSPVKGYVDLEFAATELEVEPAAFFSIAEPYHCPSEGCFGRAQDVAGELCRWFLWLPSDSARNLTIVLEPTSKIVGWVADAEGRPGPDAHMDLYVLMADGSWRSSSRSLHTSTTDGQGYFQFENVPVGLKVKVSAARGTAEGQSEPLDLKPGRMLEVDRIVIRDRKLESGIIRGCITDENGQPIAFCKMVATVELVGQSLMTDAQGCFVLRRVPADRSVTVAIRVPGCGTWSRTAAAGDVDCHFLVCPQGWDAVGQEATPLVVDRWFNHAPMTWDQLRGWVVLLTFRDFMDVDPGLSQIRNLCEEYGPRGLAVIVVCQHAPTERLADLAVKHALRQFNGIPIAGCLDADPNVAAEVTPPARPFEIGGATHWLYQVHDCPAYFLIDKRGTVRCCPRASDLEQWVQRLLDE